MISSLAALIDEYLAAVRRCVSALRRELGTNDLLRGVVSGSHPRSGQLADGTRYFFHGVGCEFEGPDLSVDVDFGPEGRMDGFDAWRLCQFANEVDAAAELRDPGAVEAALRRMEEAGIVARPNLAPSPHLYYRASPEEKVPLELTWSQALVLFEWLSKHDGSLPSTRPNKACSGGWRERWSLRSPTLWRRTTRRWWPPPRLAYWLLDGDLRWRRSRCMPTAICAPGASPMAPNAGSADTSRLDTTRNRSDGALRSFRRRGESLESMSTPVLDRCSSPST